MRHHHGPRAVPAPLLRDRRDALAFQRERPNKTRRTVSAMSGKYIRRSAPTSVAIGTTLDVGARATKNASARTPMRGLFLHIQHARAARARMSATSGKT